MSTDVIYILCNKYFIEKQDRISTQKASEIGNKWSISRKRYTITVKPRFTGPLKERFKAQKNEGPVKLNLTEYG